MINSKDALMIILIILLSNLSLVSSEDLTIIKDPSNSVNYLALAADAVGFIAPGVTGLGIAVRTAKGADKALELATTADKLSEGVQGVNKLNDAAKAEKTSSIAPNPYGSKGGPAHQSKIGEVSENIQKEGLNPLGEVTIKDPLTGTTRRADVVGIDTSSNTISEIHQVGRTTQSGQPISRERNALSDIGNAILHGAVGQKGGSDFKFNKNVKTFFHKYFKNN